jgi:hypothetical protein
MSKSIVTNCKIKGCEHRGNLDSRTGKRYFIDGFCYMHYKRNKKYGSPHKVHFIINGQTTSPVYRIHAGMKSRCYGKSDTKYKDYGGRGIKVCDRWLGINGFNNFLKDMGDRPTSQHSIDRINNNGNYEPGNCRWATIHEQSSNKRNNTDIPGVGWDSAKNKWVARLCVNKKYVLRKQFNTIEEAITAREEAERKYIHPTASF